MKIILTTLKLTSLISVLAICANAATITITNTNDSGAGSLRQAILDASPGDTINFDPSVFSSPQTITSGQLVIDKNLTIQGPGANQLSLSGNFYINNGVTAALGGLTVKNNYGGGIYNLGTLTISGITITGLGPWGNDGIYNGGAMTVSNSTITGNYFWCEECAGGIYNVGALTIMNSTISGNSAMDLGDYGSSGFEIVGGILNTGTMTIVNSSVINNEAVWNSTIINDFVGGIDNFGTATLENTIVAGNTFVPNPPDPSSSSSDILGTIKTASHNLIGDAGSSGGIQNGVNGNIVGVNPMLGPLQDNGGPTMTHALLSGSPAINAGDNCVLTVNGCGDNSPALTTDQTGYPRTGSVDIGAFEFRLTTAATVKVSGRVITSSGGGIRKAIVTMTDATTGTTRTVKAKPSGAYSFKGITAGQSYVLQAAAPGYKFEPQFLTVIGEVTDLNFIGQ